VRGQVLSPRAMGRDAGGAEGWAWELSQEP
jgi:hypothetical protein